MAIFDSLAQQQSQALQGVGLLGQCQQTTSQLQTYLKESLGQQQRVLQNPLGQQFLAPQVVVTGLSNDAPNKDTFGTFYQRLKTEITEWLKITI